MSELEELQRPLEDRELAEFVDICRKYLNPKGMMILRRLVFTCEQAAKRIAELERQLAEIRDALAGTDYGSLPSDYPTVRMAHTIRQDHDKFFEQVQYTCRRAEKAERQLAEAQKDAKRWIMFCELWCHSTVLECRQDEEGTWSILQIEPVENVVFGALVGETPSKTIDAAIRRYSGSP